MIRVRFGIGIFYFILDREIPCSSSTEMRLWFTSYIKGDLYASKRVKSLEQCMDSCLALAECKAFAYSVSGYCRMMNVATSWVALTNWTTGVRCNLASPIKEAADKTYQMSAAAGRFRLYTPPGETYFILHC